jgi:nucleotide sugar dehydrogenase
MSNPKNVSVIGIGRLGLCFALVLEKKGFDVCGSDINAAYVRVLNSKQLASPEPGVTQLLTTSRTFKATVSLEEAAKHSDMLFILVDTPSTGGERHYDHSKLGSVLMALNNLKVENKHIVIGCTVLPGYIAKVGRFLLKDCKNCTLSYNPEFIAQGDIINGQLKPDMVLIGEGSKEAGDRLQAVYEKLCDNQPRICRMSPESAEICKLGVNCFVTMKVTFSNLIGDIADNTPGADKYTICQAIGQDTRVGSKYIRPGYGFGGPCFPRDNRALGGYAEMVGIDALLFNATDEYNQYHTKQQLKAMLALAADDFVFTGVAYKPSTRVPIIEESQRLAIARGLAEAGRRVTVRDYVDTVNEVKKEYGKLFNYLVLDDKDTNAEKTEYKTLPPPSMPVSPASSFVPVSPNPASSPAPAVTPAANAAPAPTVTPASQPAAVAVTQTTQPSTPPESPKTTQDAPAKPQQQEGGGGCLIM